MDKLIFRTFAMSVAVKQPYRSQVPTLPPHLISLTKPVLVRPLFSDEREALERHGCGITPFPETRPDLLRGHMVTFPNNAYLEHDTSNQSVLLFPDGYGALLVRSQGWYHLYPERATNGSLV